MPTLVGLFERYSDVLCLTLYWVVFRVLVMGICQGLVVSKAFVDTLAHRGISVT